MRRLRAENLLPLACAGAIAMLAASEFMDILKLNSAGPTLEAVQTASDQHHYAVLVLAAFALGALIIAVAAGSKPAASAVAIAGVAALLIFLLIDLPDAGKVGTISDETFVQAKAEPATGFWIELAGALVLAVCGGALATLSPDQLRSLGRGAGETVKRVRPGGAAKPAGTVNPGPEDVGNRDGTQERPRKPSGARK